MIPEDFIELYEAALASQNWGKVSPLMHENVSVIFSDSSVHLGKEAVQKAYQTNFNIIKNESFLIEQIKWIKKSATLAIYFFEYRWSGYIHSKFVKGAGIGTTVLIKENDNWLLLTEQLEKKD